MNPPTLPVTGKGSQSGRVLLRRSGTVPPLPWSTFAPPLTYRRVLDVDLPDGPLSLDLRELDGQVFEFEVLRGHTRWFEIRDVTIDTVASIDAGAHA